MKIIFTKSFVKDYRKLPQIIQGKFDKQLKLFIDNLHYPSLKIKKIQGTGGKILEGRVSRDYRFTFQIENEFYILRRIGTHDILKTP